MKLYDGLCEHGKDFRYRCGGISNIYKEDKTVEFLCQSVLCFVVRFA
jgi:hypothetical protein